MTAPTPTAATAEELATITVRYRLPRSEAQAVMLDERARQVSWDDVFAERDAQRAEIERLTAENAAKAIELKAANSKIERMRKAAEGTDQWANEVIAAICKHVGVDDADDGFTAADLASLLEEHNAEFDAIGARATTAEADISAAHQVLTDARIPVIDDNMRVLWLDERVRMLAAERDALRRTLIDVINRGTDGGCAPEVSTEFLCFAADEAAGIKRQRDASRERERKLREAGQPVAALPAKEATNER